MNEVCESSEAPVKDSDSPHLIEIRNLHKRFETGTASIEVLKGLDLTLDVGDRVAIVGQSGVGKSTLLRLLLGFEEASEGGHR